MAFDLSLTHTAFRQNIDELDEGERELQAEEDRFNIEQALSTVVAPIPSFELPALQLPLDHAVDRYPMQQTFSCSRLVHLRRTHETERAKKSVRTRATRMNGDSHGDEQQIEKPVSETPRRAIIQQMSAILREEQDGVGPTTGLGRITRIQNQATKPAGNSVNAELAAGQRAAAVRRLR